jgi:hypothetical protein
MVWWILCSYRQYSFLASFEIELQRVDVILRGSSRGYRWLFRPFRKGSSCFPKLWGLNRKSGTKDFLAFEDVDLPDVDWWSAFRRLMKFEADSTKIKGFILSGIVKGEQYSWRLKTWLFSNYLNLLLQLFGWRLSTLVLFTILSSLLSRLAITMLLFFMMIVRTRSRPVTIFFLLFLVVFVLMLFVVPFSGLGVSSESVFAPHYIIDSIA